MQVSVALVLGNGGAGPGDAATRCIATLYDGPSTGSTASMHMELWLYGRCVPFCGFPLRRVDASSSVVAASVETCDAVET